jgi:hypothetical protein
MMPDQFSEVMLGGVGDRIPMKNTDDPLLIEI